MSNKLQAIYDEFGEDICLFPFLTGWYSVVGATNTLKPCPNIQGRWPVTNNSMLETLNSEQWRSIRKNFITGSCRSFGGCYSCTYTEKNQSDSIRMLNNKYFADALDTDVIDIVHNVIENDYHVDKIYSLDFFPSNYCNYSCIMCNGGASSSRGAFEIKVYGKKTQPAINQVDKDFYQILDGIEVINFTGGETILQPQVHELIDYLIAKDMAKNISVTMLTNVSSFPDSLVDKFKKFKRVDYTLSIDGTDKVIEYQRRGANWATVQENAIKINQNFGAIVNHVITAVNVFNFVKLVEWFHKHNFDLVILSLENTTLHLKLSAIPDELKTQLVADITTAKNNYDNNSVYANMLNQMIDILNSFEFKPEALKAFVQRIKIEDQESKHPLVDVVPEWRPYFE